MHPQIRYDVFYPATRATSIFESPTSSLHHALSKLNLAESPTESETESIGARLAAMKGIRGLPSSPVFIRTSCTSDKAHENEEEISKEPSNLQSILDDIDTFYEFKIKATEVSARKEEYREIAAGVGRIRDYTLCALDCLGREGYNKRKKAEIRSQLDAIHLHMQKVRGVNRDIPWDD